MRPKFVSMMFATLVLGAALVAALPATFAQEPTPVPMPDQQPATVVQGSTPTAVIVDACGRACCRPACPPCLVYKGCPAPCAVDKVVTACKPCGCTVQVVIKVPAGECERVRVHRDGDARYHYGRYGVHLDWHDDGGKLVVRYHG